MNYLLNTTEDYHVNNLNSLGWELTVCNALYQDSSPCRNVLLSKDSFGVQLYHFLEKLIPLHEVHNVLEVGGGLGYLMHDFLSRNPALSANMLDISPYLLEKQKEILSGFNVRFCQKDILKITADDIACFDLVILNENLGDLPTLVSHCDKNAGAEKESTNFQERVKYFKEKYLLSFPEEENINIGAMEVLDKLCLAQIKYIYLSEHSCESSIPAHLKPYLDFTSSNNPEKITLKGHDEYTIKFSNLQKIAEFCNYEVARGQFADFLPLDFNDKVKIVLRLATPFTAEQEIIQQFVYDLYKYEYMVIIKTDALVKSPIIVIPAHAGIQNMLKG
jgi:hypothetical protein